MLQRSQISISAGSRYTSSPEDGIGQSEFTNTPEPYPSIRTSHKPGTRTEVVDLQSVYDRLRATELRTDAWVRATLPTIRFLASLVNERLEPGVPLVPDDACETRPVGSRTSPAAAALRAWRPT